MKSQSKTTTTQVTETVEIPGLKIAEADSTFPYRLVGSYEYGKSLDLLGRLVSSSTPEEIDVYDKFIAMNPEYSFYSGVVSNLGLDIKYASLDSYTQQDMDSKYLKKSLAWMMALARSELGATISMYGESADPFGAAAAVGGEYGAEEYLSVLLDDLSAHLKVAQRDAKYQAALNPKEEVNESSLAYLRRTQLINDLLDKVMSSGNPEIVLRARPYAGLAQMYTKQMVDKISIAMIPITLTTQGDASADTVFSEELSGIRFHDRRGLRSCQINLERAFGPPEDVPSSLQ